MLHNSIQHHLNRSIHHLSNIHRRTHFSNTKQNIPLRNYLLQPLTSRKHAHRNMFSITTSQHPTNKNAQHAYEHSLQSTMITILIKHPPPDATHHTPAHAYTAVHTTHRIAEYDCIPLQRYMFTHTRQSKVKKKNSMQTSVLSPNTLQTRPKFFLTYKCVVVSENATGLIYILCATFRGFFSQNTTSFPVYIWRDCVLLRHRPSPARLFSQNNIVPWTSPPSTLNSARPAWAFTHPSTDGTTSPLNLWGEALNKKSKYLILPRCFSGFWFSAEMCSSLRCGWFTPYARFWGVFRRSHTSKSRTSGHPRGGVKGDP